MGGEVQWCEGLVRVRRSRGKYVLRGPHPLLSTHARARVKPSRVGTTWKANAVVPRLVIREVMDRSSGSRSVGTGLEMCPARWMKGSDDKVSKAVMKLIRR